MISAMKHCTPHCGRPLKPLCNSADWLLFLFHYSSRFAKTCLCAYFLLLSTEQQAKPQSTQHFLVRALRVGGTRCRQPLYAPHHRLLYDVARGTSAPQPGGRQSQRSFGGRDQHVRAAGDLGPPSGRRRFLAQQKFCIVPGREGRFDPEKVIAAFRPRLNDH